MIRAQQLRMDAHLSLEDLAQETNVSSRTIRRFEQGGGAQMATLAKLSTFFGVPVTHLLQGVPEFEDQPKKAAA